MIKLFAFDLDGTLLKENQTISKPTLAMLKKLQSEGRRLAFSTGRNLGYVTPILEMYELDVDLIVNSGHEIISKQFNKIYPFSWDKLNRILPILIENDMYISVWGEKGSKFSFYDMDSYYQRNVDIFRGAFGEEKMKKFMQMAIFTKDVFTMNYKQIEEISDYEHINALKVDAVTLNKDSHLKVKAELEKIGGLELASTPDCVHLEMIENNSNKGHAVTELGAHFGIGRDEIAAFGDSGNDLSLLRAIEHSFAMGNATDEVKTASRYVTDTNNNDGVLKGIEMLLSKGL